MTSPPSPSPRISRPACRDIRLAVFAETTSPLIDYYRDRGILVEVDGDQPPESITADIKGYLP